MRLNKILSANLEVQRKARRRASLAVAAAEGVESGMEALTDIQKRIYGWVVV
jgi:hypothetical protein